MRKLYDGAQWLVVGAIDQSGHLWVPPIGGGTVSIATAVHRRAYERTLDAKNKADAAFKAACKRARAELGNGAIDDIKDLIRLETPEGEAAFKALAGRMIRVARWANMDVGFQGSLFPTVDRRDAEKKAFNEGKKAGLEGKSKQPPHHTGVPQFEAWMRGWEAGQEVVGQGFKPLAADDESSQPAH